MARFTKKQESFLNLSIQISDFKNWYIVSDERNGKTFAIKERKIVNGFETGQGSLVFGYGTEKEVQSFVFGFRYSQK